MVYLLIAWWIFPWQTVRKITRWYRWNLTVKHVGPKHDFWSLSERGGPGGVDGCCELEIWPYQVVVSPCFIAFL